MGLTEEVHKYAAERGITENEALSKGMAENSEDFVHRRAEVREGWLV